MKTIKGEYRTNPQQNTNQHQPMKTYKIAAIATVLSIAASSSLWAAAPGKHVVEKVPHRHGASEGAAQTAVNHTLLKRVGPAGKGFVKSLSKSR